ncbi:MAG: hypothetical protein ABEN55_14060, partial [Bradymonadaceae bacterium]
MGADFVFVNRDREELITSLGPYKLHWVASRAGGLTARLISLVTVRADGLDPSSGSDPAQPSHVGNTDERLVQLAGSWVGDDVCLASSYAEPTVGPDNG